MIFSVLQTECFSQLGMDSADATNIASVKRWLNIAQQDICMRYPWPFLQTRESIATVVDFTGDASIVQGSASFTDDSFSVGSGDIGKFVQFEGANDWYRISSFAGPNFPTMDIVYKGATGTKGYTIRKFFYSLSSSVDRILDIKNWEKSIRIVNTDFGTMDWLTGSNQAVGGVSSYAMYGLDSSGNVQLTFYPFPTTLQVYEVKYLKRPTDMSADADLSIIPVKWHHVLVDGALVYGFQYLRKLDLAKSWTAYYAEHLDTMTKNCKSSLDEVPVLRSIDQFNKSNWIRLPGEFPVLGSAGD